MTAPPRPKRIRIVSENGIAQHTRIFDAETGEDLSAKLHCTHISLVVGEPTIATLTVLFPLLDIVADARYEEIAE